MLVYVVTLYNNAMLNRPSLNSLLTLPSVSRNRARTVSRTHFGERQLTAGSCLAVSGVAIESKTTLPIVHRETSRKTAIT